jgi:hypothetical protein
MAEVWDTLERATLPEPDAAHVIATAVLIGAWSAASTGGSPAWSTRAIGSARELIESGALHPRTSST